MPVPGRPLSWRGSDVGPASGHLYNNAATSTTVQLSVSMAGDGSDLTFVTADALALVSSYLSQNSSSGPILAAAIAVANNSATGSPEAFFVQRCANTNMTTTKTVQNTFGVAVTNGGNMTRVKQAVELWASGACLDASTFASLPLTGGKGLTA
ncbi:hypothetical protein Sste5346_009934 [Sporothrix stenoceras]|uniref:Uncharacterized protein n=1 Tax=Sporothrix stenoceras TaxID=5173 RepID=A0ABR3YJC0_9PEZI